MPKTRSDLYAFLGELGIATVTIDHAAIFTVAEGTALRLDMPGLHSKNLFLKDKKGRLFLVVAVQDSVVDLKRLHERIGGSGRLSFGSAELLLAVLGVTPGSVTPFALINDENAAVTLVLDARFTTGEDANFHPLENTATTRITAADLMNFVTATGHPPIVVEFTREETADAGEHL